jgi:hypothetical protein
VRSLLVRTGAALAVAVGLITAVPSTAVAVPLKDYHDVVTSGWMHIKDDERRRDDIGDHTMKDVKFRLIEGFPSDTHTWWACQGNEVRVNFRLDAVRISGRPGWIKVTAKGDLYEGISSVPCGASDREDTETVTFEVGPNATVNKMMHLETRERRSDDYGDVHFTVANFFEKI